jgi:hypothetical protein
MVFSQKLKKVFPILFWFVRLFFSRLFLLWVDCIFAISHKHFPLLLKLSRVTTSLPAPTLSNYPDAATQVFDNFPTSSSAS